MLVSYSFSFNFDFILKYSSFYKAVLVSGEQESDSVTHTHISILFHILFSHMLLQNTENNSLGYIAGPCWLSVLCRQ